jgi:LuxR family maltose regulon positive regulatory protein
VLAGTLLARDTPVSRQQARILLTQMDDYYRSIHHTTMRIRVLALQAMLHSAEGDEPQALTALSSSIALAAPGGFLRLFVDLGTPLKPLLCKLAQNLARQGMSPAYLDEILAAFGPGEPQDTAPAAAARASALLTDRELEVLELLAQRLSAKEIAASLFISPNTAKRHILHIYEKLQVNTRRDAVIKAQSLGLLTSR